METNTVVSAETTLKIHSEFSDVFTGIGDLHRHFFLQVKDNVKPYQVLPRCIGYVQQEPFKKELEEHKILALLGMDKWLNHSTTLS